MWNGLDETTRQLILDHARHPRNFRQLLPSDLSASGENAMCGDRLGLGLQIRDNLIHDAAFDGAGCAIVMASASLMTIAIFRKTLAEASRLADGFIQMVV